MRRRTGLVTWSIVLLAAVMAAATVPLSAGPRTAALAIAGGLVVVTSESGVSLVRWRRWSSRRPLKVGRISLRQDVVAAIAVGAVGAGGAWLLVVASAAFPGRGWPVVAFGGFAALTALLAIAAAPTSQAPRPGRRRAQPPSEMEPAGDTSAGDP